MLWKAIGQKDSNKNFLRQDSICVADVRDLWKSSHWGMCNVARSRSHGAWSSKSLWKWSFDHWTRSEDRKRSRTIVQYCHWKDLENQEPSIPSSNHRYCLAEASIDIVLTQALRFLKAPAIQWSLSWSKRIDFTLVTQSQHAVLMQIFEGGPDALL